MTRWREHLNSVSGRAEGSAGTGRSLDHMENGNRIHPTSISNDPRARRKIRLCAVPVFVDAEDQVRQASASVERKLSRHVVGCPEAHDLEEPLTAGIGAMPEGKIGKDQRATGGDRLRLADHIPHGGEPSELPGETLLHEAVGSARRPGDRKSVV